jgi:hypothetical protein
MDKDLEQIKNKIINATMNGSTKEELEVLVKESIDIIDNAKNK